MKQFTYTIANPLGIHARPAGMLAKIAGRYADTEITVTCGGKSARAGQLMRLMSLGAVQGSEVVVRAEGAEEEAAIAALGEFFRSSL